jgi:hypothetical protein
MKKLLVLGLLVLGTGCGLSAKDTEAVGQVKRIAHQTPLICPEQYILDMSLGVLRGGNGSMSKEDLFIRVQSPDQLKLLNEAALSGQPVRVTYDVQRVAFCWEEREMTKVELLK